MSPKLWRPTGEAEVGPPVDTGMSLAVVDLSQPQTQVERGSSMAGGRS